MRAAVPTLDAAEWRRLLNTSLTPNPESRLPNPDSVAFVLEAVAQPFAEAGACCHEPPVLGVLREEGHGARRTLLCGRCLTEREYLRVVCPACGEQQFDALPVYTADQFAHVRIDACDSCRRYLKTIDLSKDGLAEPIVDDLASVAMDLWAREQGYVRTRPNLLRL
jgi:FdhE protein